MTESSNKTEWNEQTQAELYQALAQLYDTLRAARWDAKKGDKKRIEQWVDAVSGVLTQLNRQSIQARTTEFGELEVSVQNLMPQLEEVKEEIAALIGHVETATKIAKAVDKVAENVGKYLL